MNSNGKRNRDNALNQEKIVPHEVEANTNNVKKTCHERIVATAAERVAPLKKRRKHRLTVAVLSKGKALCS